MNLPLSVIIAVLAVGIHGIPAGDDKKGIITSGTNEGSIFQFGDVSRCRKILYDSGACGLRTHFKGKVPSDKPFVAVPSHVFDEFGQAQNNRLCGKEITMNHMRITRKAIVADVNMSKEQSIDMCLDDWQAFGGKGGVRTLGRGIKWTIGKQVVGAVVWVKI